MEELDELTGVMTRSAILNQLDQAVAAAGQENHTLTLIFLDLDHFMRFNEEYGHVVGDMFINGIMKMFKDTFGQDHLVGRYGGDEFVAAVRGADAATLFERAEELRNQIEKNGPYVTVNNTQISDRIYGYTGSGYLSRRRRKCNQFDRKSSPGHVPGERGRREYGLLLRGERCLTGIYNQYGITRKLDEALATARKQRDEVSLLLVDIDEFKQINDEFGHRAGDEVLKRVASVFTSNFEKELVGRLYGDSFVVVFPGKRADSAFVLAEEVRRVLEDSVINFTVGKNSRTISFRISGGVATFPNDATERVDLIRKADEALYRAKRTGRNRICLPASAQMVTKTSHYTQTQLERLAAVARQLEKSEAFLLREALDDLLRKYGDRPGEG
jgi:diguanylate cyclase (GGDEF)-like protein